MFKLKVIEFLPLTILSPLGKVNMAKNSLYTSLETSQNEIRLVSIIPSQINNEPVCCLLDAVLLNDQLSYILYTFSLEKHYSFAVNT